MALGPLLLLTALGAAAVAGSRERPRKRLARQLPEEFDSIEALRPGLVTGLPSETISVPASGEEAFIPTFLERDKLYEVRLSGVIRCRHGLFDRCRAGETRTRPTVPERTAGPFTPESGGCSHPWKRLLLPSRHVGVRVPSGRAGRSTVFGAQSDLNGDTRAHYRAEGRTFVQRGSLTSSS